MKIHEQKVVLLFLLGYLDVEYMGTFNYSESKSDVALALSEGTKKAIPVFRERINQSISLYK